MLALKFLDWVTAQEEKEKLCKPRRLGCVYSLRLECEPVILLLKTLLTIWVPAEWVQIPSILGSSASWSPIPCPALSLVLTMALTIKCYCSI